MDYRYFDMGTVVAIIAAWVDPNRNRPILEEIPRAAPFLEELDEIYATLGRLQLTESAYSKTLKALTQQAGELDSTHDKLYKGLHGMITVTSELTCDADYAEKLDEMRDRFFPIGLKGISQTYLAESGYATIAEMKVTEEDKALLTGITYNERTLLQDFEDWVTAGKALGEVEAKRTRLQEREGDTGTTAGDIRDARISGLRLVDMLATILEMPGTTDEETKNILLQPLRRAEEKALQKARRKSQEEEPDIETTQQQIDEALSEGEVGTEEDADESVTGS
jgi:hypothetical protein